MAQVSMHTNLLGHFSQEPAPHLVSIFKAKTKINELKTLVIWAPENVARFEIGVHVSLAMQKTQRLQDVPGTVLDQPHGVTLAASSHQQLRHTHIQKLQQQASCRDAQRVVIGKYTIQRHYRTTKQQLS